MKIEKVLVGYLSYFALLVFATLLTSTTTFATEKLLIYTVNYPLQYFAQRIGGEFVTVKFPAPADVDPAYWSPETKTVAEYQSADIILLNGANYAKWVNKASLPRRRLVDTSREFSSSLIKTEHGAVHNHGPGGEHSHAGIAFTTWLDFSQAMQQAEAITEVLIKKRPAYEPIFKKNTQRLLQDLLQLDQAMQQIGSQLDRQPVLASHPVYQYLVRRYNLNLKSVTWEPDKYPTSAQWRTLQEISHDFAAKSMLWESQPLEKTVLKLQNKGIAVVVFNPCMNRPAEGDFLTVMQQNIKHLPKLN